MQVRDAPARLKRHSAEEMTQILGLGRVGPLKAIRSHKGTTSMAAVTVAEAGGEVPLSPEADSEDMAEQRWAGLGLPSPPSTDAEGTQQFSSEGVQEKKRKRLADQHNKSEQRRRRKINAKLDELQSMVPFSRSREKAAILLDVIEYIKSVQAQLHIMSAVTACDYAAYRSPLAESYVHPFIGSGPPMSPTPIFPPAMADRKQYFGGDLGMPELEFRDMDGGILRSNSTGAEAETPQCFKRRNDGRHGGLSLSSGESSLRLGTGADDSFEPLVY